MDKLPRYLEKPDIDAIIAAAPDARARRLFLLLWRGGLRISEAVALRPVDCTFGPNPAMNIRQHLTRGRMVRGGKRSRERQIPLHPELAAVLEAAAGERTRRQQGEPFVPVTAKTGWHWLKAAADTAGVDLDGGPHILRHSAARHWLAEGVPLNSVQSWLGHSSLQTTSIYLRVLGDAGGFMARVA